MAKDLQKDLQELLAGGFLKVVRDNRGEYYCLTDNQQGNTAAYPLYDNEFRKELKKLYYNQFNEAEFYVSDALDEAEREFTIKQRLEYAKGQSWHYNSENHMLKRSVERSH